MALRKNLSVLEYRLPMFSDELKARHADILKEITKLSKDEIAKKLWKRLW